MALTYQQKLEYTAQKYGIPVDEVERRLQGADSAATPTSPETGTQTRVEQKTPAAEPRGFLQGVGIKNEQGELNSPAQFASSLVDSSLNIKAGGLIGEQLIKLFDEDLYDINRQSEVYRKWQPEIAAAQDEMDLAPEKSQARQQAFEKLTEARRNMVLDLEGRYVEETPDMSFSDMIKGVGDEKSFFLGQMTKAMIADPALLLVPAGYMKAANAAYKATLATRAASLAVPAKLAGGATGAGSIGATLGGASEIIEQLDENPEAPIDFNKVVDTAAKTAAFAAAIPGSLGAAKEIGSGAVKAISKGMDRRTAEKVQETAQKIWTDSLDADGNPQLSKKTAVIRAFREVDRKKTSAKEVPPIDEFMSTDALKIAKGKENAKLTLRQKTMDALSQGYETVASGWNRITQPIMSRLRDLGMVELATKLERHDRDLMTDIQNKLNVKQQWSDQYSKLSKQDKDLVHYHLSNGTIDIFLDKPGVASRLGENFIESTKQVQGMLSSMYDDMADAGFTVGYRPNYFPREMNYGRYAADQGLTPSGAKQRLAEAINRKLNLQGDDRYTKSITDAQIQQNLSNDEISRVLSKGVLSGDKQGANLGPNASKARTIEEIKPENLHYYSDPTVALTNYIIRNTTKTHDRKFFGGKALKGQRPDMDEGAVTESMYREIINDFVKKGKETGEFFGKEADEVSDILQSRFIGGMRSPGKAIAGTKNVLYAITLGNPISAGVQFGDLGSSAYINDIASTAIEAVSKFKRSAKKLAGNKDADAGKVTMEDFGLDALAHEYEHLGKTAKLLDTSMRLGGFKAVDRLGKEVILNSTAKKLRAKATGKNADKYFDERFGGRLSPDEISEIKKAFSADELDLKNDHVRLALFSELTKVQPISLSQMPQAYLNNPNARIFYMLKSFTLKQLDLARNDLLKQAGKPGLANKAKAARNLARMGLTIGLANAGVEQTKNWMLGRENLDLHEAAFVSLLRNWGISQYTLGDIARGDITGGLAAVMAPPLQVGDDVIKYIMQDDYPEAKLMRHIPVAGKPLYYWMTGSEPEPLDKDFDLDFNFDEDNYDFGDE